MKTTLHKDYIEVTVLDGENGTLVRIYQDRCEVVELNWDMGEHIDQVFPLGEIREAIELAKSFT